MLARLLRRVTATSRVLVQARRRPMAATRPAAPVLVAGALMALVRGKSALIAENALLRQHLLVLRRSVKRPRCTPTDRVLLVQPDTLLRGHRELFRGTVPAATIALIRAMATANALWGAERSRGELLKLDIRVAKWTVQKYLRDARPPRRAGQPWATFLRNHAGAIWACDFLPVTAVLFRPVAAFFVIAPSSRRVVHGGVTRHPTDAWVAQRLREATPFGQRPAYRICDNDSRYGPAFTRVAAASGSTVLRTAYRAPRQHATCARFLGGVRRACLDHVLALSEAHRRRVLREYASYCNGARPHQGVQQHLPDGSEGPVVRPETDGKIQALPVLGGLHHASNRAAQRTVNGARISQPATTAGAQRRSPGQRRGDRLGAVGARQRLLLPVAAAVQRYQRNDKVASPPSES